MDGKCPTSAVDPDRSIRPAENTLKLLARHRLDKIRPVSNIQGKSHPPQDEVKGLDGLARAWGIRCLHDDSLIG